MYIFYHTYASYCAITCELCLKYATYADYHTYNTIIASQIRGPCGIYTIIISVFVIRNNEITTAKQEYSQDIKQTIVDGDSYEDTKDIGFEGKSGNTSDK